MWHDLEIWIFCDVEIQKIQIAINTSSKHLGPYDDRGFRHCYPCLNNVMTWQIFGNGMACRQCIHWRVGYGDTLCRTADLPPPDRRFTIPEMEEWLKEHEICQVSWFAKPNCQENMYVL
jgi:hypothetical protein